MCRKITCFVRKHADAQMHTFFFRQGSAGDKPSSSQQSKRKGGDMDDDSNSKKRKVHSPIIELSDSDSD
ncbi:hypothetical protein B9Z55_000682 [Caenorhabditis nigoni]|uniref:Uncharacterized protein n=1 Tax=Caenorhabditis nigoni TaxID=1611254 RepID=A0A2G5VUP9_9PELO|nr:hypothetical protein B9Z55_000682 [Caenorhabditis nigoni]